MNRLVVTDDTGAELDTGWAKRLLEERGLKLRIHGQQACEDEMAPPPPLVWTVTLYRPGDEAAAPWSARAPRVIAELECEQGARVRTAKQLLVALDVGLLGA